MSNCFHSMQNLNRLFKWMKARIFQHSSYKVKSKSNHFFVSLYNYEIYINVLFQFHINYFFAYIFDSFSLTNLCEVNDGNKNTSSYLMGLKSSPLGTSGVPDGLQQSTPQSRVHHQVFNCLSGPLIVTFQPYPAWRPSFGWEAKKKKFVLPFFFFKFQKQSSYSY